MTTGQRLAEARREKGHTSARAGELVGVNRISMSRYENGHLVPPLRVAVKIEEAYGIPVRDWVPRQEGGDR